MTIIFILVSAAFLFVVLFALTRHYDVKAGLKIPLIATVTFEANGTKRIEPRTTTKDPASSTG